MRFANYLLVLLSVSLLACDDIIVPEIGAKTPNILAPADSSVIAASAVTFRWEAVSGADGYQLQIAQPTFANATRYLLDTVTRKTTFSKTLNPGAYEWRIRAVNASYSGPYVVRWMRVDSASSISGEDLTLTQPANSSITNVPAVTLVWQPIAAAERYLVHLTPSPRGSGAAFDTVLYGVSQLALRFPAQDQQYRWSVTALNATGATHSDAYAFTIDVTAPAAPTLTTPLDSVGIALLDTVAFAWTRGAADVVRDSLFIYLADQTTKVASFPRSFAGSSFSWPTTASTLQAGTHFWAIKSVDRAGNVGPLSGKRRLLLQ